MFAFCLASKRGVPSVARDSRWLGALCTVAVIAEQIKSPAQTGCTVLAHSSTFFDLPSNRPVAQAFRCGTPASSSSVSLDADPGGETPGELAAGDGGRGRLRHASQLTVPCAVRRKSKRSMNRKVGRAVLCADGCNHHFLKRKARRARSDAPCLGQTGAYEKVKESSP